MARPAVKEGGFTYGDLHGLPQHERWELIDGVAYDMSPAPSTRHQTIVRNLMLLLGNHLKGHRCKLFSAPFDVRLPSSPDQPDRSVSTVVQPDLVVVCEAEKLDERGCRGAPSLVVEILSPGTARKDLLDKFLLYQRVGVQEYWIVQPLDEILQVYPLQTDGRYGPPDVLVPGDKLSSELLPGLVFDVAEVFAE